MLIDFSVRKKCKFIGYFIIIIFLCSFMNINYLSLDKCGIYNFTKKHAAEKFNYSFYNWIIILHYNKLLINSNCSLYFTNVIIVIIGYT